MSAPLVSVVCLCHNQCRFVGEAIQSVLKQTYGNIQLIVVDDASTDESVAQIKEAVRGRPTVETLFIDVNTGHCKAFNRALLLVKGEFIIDLAADDVLLADRIEEGVKWFQQAGRDCGVHFSDAEWVDEKGKHLYNHSERYPHETIPTGHIYKELISRYFICPPTMMFTKRVMEELRGYDEHLSYEDFDFWIRSSRTFKYGYTPKILVKKRMVSNSQGRKQFQLFSRQSKTTYRVCEKIMGLNSSRMEQEALSKRLLYEMRLNVRLLNFRMVKKYFTLWNRNRELKYADS